MWIRRAGASETTSEDQMDGSNKDFDYWQLGLPRERILFVDSRDSEEFNILLVALDGAKVVAMDAEWKPVRKAGSVPRVSILQLSCCMDNMSMSWASIDSFRAQERSVLYDFSYPFIICKTNIATILLLKI